MKELEVHSRIFDEMGFLPPSPYNKINIHVGGTYGDKEATLERFAKVRRRAGGRGGWGGAGRWPGSGVSLRSAAGGRGGGLMGAQTG